MEQVDQISVIWCITEIFGEYTVYHAFQKERIVNSNQSYLHNILEADEMRMVEEYRPVPCRNWLGKN